MKIIITENRRTRFVTKWMDDNYGDLKLSKSPLVNRILYYDDNLKEIIFIYIPDSKLITIRDMMLVTDLTTMFGLTKTELTHILSPWIEKRYGIEVQLTTY